MKNYLKKTKTKKILFVLLLLLLISFNSYQRLKQTNPQPANQLTNPQNNQITNKPSNQKTNQPINQLTGQLVNQPTSQLADNSKELIKVVKVIDGDTIVLENGKTVRYIGIDTPELHHPKKAVECFAQEAKMTNENLVLGKKVKLEKDISETDKYGRLLRYVYVKKSEQDESEAKNEASESGMIFVNEYLLREGFARLSTFPPDVKYVNLFQKAEKEARENNRGLYQKCL